MAREPRSVVFDLCRDLLIAIAGDRLDLFRRAAAISDFFTQPIANLSWCFDLRWFSWRRRGGSCRALPDTNTIEKIRGQQ
jgi:hypothetical protein